MIKITHQQILNRYDTIPERLKEAGFSPFNTKIIQQIGEEQHFTDDKVSEISKLVGYILFGFIHPEDLAKEIKIELDIAPEIANAVAQEVDQKIFASIREELEKVYQPPTEEKVLDLRKKSGSPESEETGKAKIGSMEITEEEKVEKEVKSLETQTSIKQAPTPTIEKPLQTPEALEEEKQKIIPTPEKNLATAPKAPLSEPAITPSSVFGGVNEEAPLIIHKEAEFKPLAGTKKSLGGLFSFLRKDKNKKEKRTPVKAQVEIGGMIKQESAPFVISPLSNSKIKSFESNPTDKIKPPVISPSIKPEMSNLGMDKLEKIKPPTINSLGKNISPLSSFLTKSPVNRAKPPVASSSTESMVSKVEPPRVVNYIDTSKEIREKSDVRPPENPSIKKQNPISKFISKFKKTKNPKIRIQPETGGEKEISKPAPVIIENKPPAAGPSAEAEPAGNKIDKKNKAEIKEEEKENEEIIDLKKFG